MPVMSTTDATHAQDDLAMLTKKKIHNGIMGHGYWNEDHMDAALERLALVPPSEACPVLQRAE